MSELQQQLAGAVAGLILGGANLVKGSLRAQGTPETKNFSDLADYFWEGPKVT